jgi:hypothetical protein
VGIAVHSQNHPQSIRNKREACPKEDTARGQSEDDGEEPEYAVHSLFGLVLSPPSPLVLSPPVLVVLSPPVPVVLLLLVPDIPSPPSTDRQEIGRNIPQQRG